MEKDNNGQSKFYEIVRAPIVREPIYAYDEDTQGDISRGEGEGLGVSLPATNQTETTSSIPTRESK